MRIVIALMGLLMFSENAFLTASAFINAKIYTGEKISEDDAFLVENGRFVLLSKSSAIKNGTKEVIDLKGALVLPGFIESHAHLLGLGQSKINLDLRQLSKAEIVDKVKTQAKKQKSGTWITGRGWDQNTWPDKSFPHKDLFKDIDNPIYLRRVDGHAAWVNDVVLRKASIDKTTIDRKGGHIIRDKSGQATGVLIDNAIDLVNVHLENPSTNDLLLYFDLAQKEALSRGITSFHDAGASKNAIDLFLDLAEKNQLLLRLNVMIDGNDQKLVDDFLRRGPFISDFLTIRSIKYFADGALGSRGASLLEPYHDDPTNRGLLLTDKPTLLLQTEKAINQGFQVATHAIGDEANRLVLDVYEAALKKTAAKNARLRVEHAQIVDKLDHERFKKLSVIASMQPIHCTSDMTWVPDRLSSDRIKDRAYPWRSLLNEGAVLAFGSDAPVEDINPILSLHAAVTRSDTKGEPKNGFMPEQKLKLAQALRAYHEGAAYAEFNEHQKGKIAPGYFADFVVFDTDILHPEKATFLKARPMMTVVNGVVVYKRDEIKRK